MKKAGSQIYLAALLIFFVACDDGVEIRPLESGIDASCNPPSSNDYALPYPIGETYKLFQGICGSFDHELDFRYAFDFEMPIGSVVTAAAEGVVTQIEEGFDDGSHDRQTTNQLIVEHENGSFGRYLHLTKNGALVEIGDLVKRGDTIALSGDTGFISKPLLHFDVGRCGISCDDFKSTTFGFFNADQPVEKENIFYTAESF